MITFVESEYSLSKTETVIVSLPNQSFSGDIKTSELRDKMQKTMQRYAPVYRDEETLKKGIDIMKDIFASFKNINVSDKSMIWNTDLVETLELNNLLIRRICF